ncbi:hypothetical protein ABFS83_10G018400 [Erythranthe nasuta]
MASQIANEENSCMGDKQGERIRQILNYQKTLHHSSSSFSSSLASPTKSSSSLIELMKGGSTSLRRLFDMEHTSLANYFNNYSLSPLVKPILLWASDDDSIHDDPWAEFKKNEVVVACSNDEDFIKRKIRLKSRGRKLIRTKSYKSLPRFRFLICRRIFKFKFRLRLSTRKL